jgi:uncharacterized membrane protein
MNEKIKDMMNTSDKSEKFTDKDKESGKVMAALSYILAPIPYFTEKKNKFVEYHAKQGMDLLLIYIAYAIIYSILTSLIKGSCGSYYGISLGNFCTPWWVRWPLNIIGYAIGIISLIGLINAINGKAKELPIVNKFKIFNK